MTDLDRIAALVKALQDIRDCAGQPARVYRLAVLALDDASHNKAPICQTKPNK